MRMQAEMLKLLGAGFAMESLALMHSKVLSVSNGIGFRLVAFVKWPENMAKHHVTSDTSIVPRIAEHF